VDNRRNLLVTLANEKYIPQARQLFSSVYWNAGWDGDYLLLAHEIPEEKLGWFKEKGILIKNCQLLLEVGYGLKMEFSPLIYDKYYLFTEEFKKWKHIIYLDSDIIVKGPLDRLTQIKTFGAARNLYYGKLFHEFHNPQNNQINGISYDLDTTSLNGGFFSFNTDIITPGLFDEMKNFLSNHVREFVMGEQTALNIHFYKKWEKFPLIFSVFPTGPNFKSFRIPKRLKFVAIHYIVTGETKYPLWNPQNPYFKEWETNLAKAEEIDLKQVQHIKPWSSFKIRYYSAILKLYVYFFRIRHSLLLFHIKFFFTQKVKFFFTHTIKIFILRFFQLLTGSPERLMGFIGKLLKKYVPSLFYKLKK